MVVLEITVFVVQLHNITPELREIKPYFPPQLVKFEKSAIFTP